MSSTFPSITSSSPSVLLPLTCLWEVLGISHGVSKQTPPEGLERIFFLNPKFLYLEPQLCSPVKENVEQHQFLAVCNVTESNLSWVQAS